MKNSNNLKLSHKSTKYEIKIEQIKNAFNNTINTITSITDILFTLKNKKLKVYTTVQVNLQCIMSNKISIYPNIIIKYYNKNR